MGHFETADLVCGSTEKEARDLLEAFPLPRVREILEGEIVRRRSDDTDG